MQKLILKLFGRFGTFVKFPSNPTDSFQLEVKHIPAQKSLAAKVKPDDKWHWTWFKKIKSEPQQASKEPDTWLVADTPIGDMLHVNKDGSVPGIIYNAKKTHETGVLTIDIIESDK